MSHPLILIRNRVLSPAECLGGYPTPRGADGIGVGVGCRLGLRRRRWTPASLPSLAAWYEAVDVDATLVKATAPVFVNSAFADASWWSVARGALSVVDASPRPGNALRVTATSADPAAYKSILIAGNRYQAYVYGRGDGTNAPNLGDGSPGAYGTGTSSTEWQYIGSEKTAGDALFAMYHNGATGTADFWGPTATNLSRTRWNPRAGSLGGYLSQATAGSQPWWATDGVYFAAGDSIVSSLAASAWIPLHYKAGNGANDAPDLVVASVFTVATAGDNVLFWTGTPGASAYMAATGVMTFKIAAGGDVASVNSPASTIVAGAKVLITCTSNASGVTIRKNGVEVATGAYSGACSSSDPNTTLWVGNATGSNGLQGKIHEQVIAFQSDAASIARIEADLMARHGL